MMENLNQDISFVGSCPPSTSITTPTQQVFQSQSQHFFFFFASFYGLAITYLLSIALPKLDVVFGLTGAIAGTVIVFSFPGLFYILLYDEREKSGLSSSPPSLSSCSPPALSVSSPPLPMQPVVDIQDLESPSPNWKFYFTPPPKMMAMLMVFMTGILAIISVIQIIFR
eukprot:TRINITY_DN7692_c0_g1_i6.p1 TRINITY_DN7692_c0_g1~~TRINITY_DN7692_c0_g1_i6.p1  ORF type:complete len:169 (+),score=34.85 TRINITY_DN7692_c0_g1_i6:588-1094(+)